MTTEETNNHVDAISDEEKFSTLYFGYASNLSPQTLSQRCPDCLFAGIARLDDYKIFINETRYGNIKPSPGDVVYGTLAFLSTRGEKALDVSEGVPWLYEKHKLKMTRIGQGDGESDREVEALAYVDVERTADGETEPDYIPWLQKAIIHGLQCGVPEWYVDKYLRPFIPATEKDAREINFVRLIGLERD